MCFTIFTLRPVLEYVRVCGIRTALYVDDWLVAAWETDINKHSEFLNATLEDLDWTINYEKSSLEPEHTKTWIGYVISANPSEQPSLCINKDKTRKLRRDIQRALRQKVLTARALARIAGQCIAMAQVIFPAKLLLRNVYRLIASKVSRQDKL